MPVGGMHIRHDWQTWVEWEQKSVRTVCGKTTGSHLAGIPGITGQPDTIVLKGKTYYGWCTTCSVAVHRQCSKVIGMREVHSYIALMYKLAHDLTLPIYMAYVVRQEVVRRGCVR